MALYDQAYIRVNGRVLVENTTVDVSVEGDDQEVMTIAQGFTGISPSPKVTRITADNVVPITGVEIDVVDFFLNSIECDVSVQLGGSGAVLSTKGYFAKAVKMSAGVGKTLTLNFEFVGKPANFE